MRSERLLHPIIAGVLIAAGLILIPVVSVSANSTSEQYTPIQHISPNIPLDSYIYDYLEKLDGLGLISDMRIGARPYTRLDAAKWVGEAAAKAKDNLPTYAKMMLARLQDELRPELAQLSGNGQAPEFNLREVALETAYYKGDSLTQNRTASSYQPLNPYNNGYKYAAKANGVLTARLEGSFGSDLVVSITPRFSYDDANQYSDSLLSGYFKTRINNVEIQFGKDPMWWGQGAHGSLALTNNSSPQTGIRFSNIDPIRTNGFFKFLGPIKATAFYSEMADDRSANDYPSPGFLGMRADFTPTRNFTFGLARTSIVGGKGHGLSHGDWWDFLSGTNASNSSEDRWNSIAGIDFRWRLPQYHNIQLYGELYGEDQAKVLIIPGPSKVAEIVGVYIPNLAESGKWDATVEYGHTTNSWYSHSVYRDGYVHKGNIIGDAMGHNARRYYAQLTHYTDNATSISLNAEMLTMDLDAANPQKVNSVWLTVSRQLERDLRVTASGGIAHIKNMDYTAGSTDDNYLASVTVIKSF
jgi:hypothetical protein